MHSNTLYISYIEYSFVNKKSYTGYHGLRFYCFCHGQGAIAASSSPTTIHRNSVMKMLRAAT